MRNLVIILFSLFINWSFLYAQEIDYKAPKEYKIAGILVDGATRYDHEFIIELSGLYRGKTIEVPGTDISNAIKKLWDQRLFSNVTIIKNKIIKDNIYLTIKLAEVERVRYKTKICGEATYIKGLEKKGHRKQLREELDIEGRKATDNLLNEVRLKTQKFLVDKGYYYNKVSVRKAPSKCYEGRKTNYVDIFIDIEKGEKIKIREITFSGNENIADKKLRAKMKNTKRTTKFKTFWTFLKRSKFIPDDYEEDKQAIINNYNTKSYRDAIIIKDSIYKVSKKRINIDMSVEEGNQYYYRNISWAGNKLYSTGRLDSVLGIKKGDLYNKDALYLRLHASPNSTDVTSLYQDYGYLFFSVNAVEKNIENDSIDLEISIYEGKPTYIRNITIVGNDKTSEKVIRRMLYTYPGDLFRRNLLIQSQRELANLGYFDPQALSITPKPDPINEVVDIEYGVAEKSTDQVELSAGWGANSFIGTIGLSFNNFSLRKIGDLSAWDPLPSGDGQRLSLRFQANDNFQSLNFSFTEPWLGGKKPTSLSVSTFYSINGRNSSSSLSNFGVSVGIGKRLKWPDNNFSILHQLSYQYYVSDNFEIFPDLSSGYANNIAYQFRISRNSIDYPIYPTEGSQIAFTFKTTPPYSLFNQNVNYAEQSNQERFKFLEYNKIKFTTSFFSALTHGKNKLVLNTRVGFGFLNAYNSERGITPFERFYLGGSGLTGFNIDSRELIALRGYDDAAISSEEGDRIIARYVMELRYPLSLSPSATIFPLIFAEAGNTWQSYDNFNPFEVKRSAGVGLRLFLPIFGLIGLDYGWSFDDLNQNSDGLGGHVKNRGLFQFSLGMNIGEL